MICYMVKNKQEKYLNIDIIGEWNYTSIENASTFNDYQLAECYCPSDCKVVKVEIKEIKDGKID